MACAGRKPAEYAGAFPAIGFFAAVAEKPIS